jgi:hypothetical protein
MFLARRFGPDFVLPTIQAAERADSSSYDAQPEAAGTSLPSDERSHARLVSALSGSHGPGLHGGAIARLEGRRHRGLGAGDVRPVPAYVKPEAEAEPNAAFRQTREVRQAGGSARDLADRYFFETAVRLHRQGEGAAYTGLKEIVDVGPALVAAERAVETGDIDTVYAVVGGAVRSERREGYRAVVAARERAAHEGIVTAARERAEAELAFETYVDRVYQAALGRADHDGEAAALPGQH